jgi:hypothetical protein
VRFAGMRAKPENPAKAACFDSKFASGGSKHFQAKWIPVRVKKMR